MTTVPLNTRYANERNMLFSFVQRRILVQELRENDTGAVTVKY
jgi:hypothetical protein